MNAHLTNENMPIKCPVQPDPWIYLKWFQDSFIQRIEEAHYFNKTTFEQLTHIVSPK